MQASDLWERRNGILLFILEALVELFFLGGNVLVNFSQHLAATGGQISAYVAWD